MLAYRYDNRTKEFLYGIRAQKNPKGTEYLLPANSTFIEVPDKIEGYTQVFDTDNNVWSQVRDHRNNWEVKLSDITFDKVDYLGEAKEGYEFITDEVYNNYQEDPDRYKVVDGHFTDIKDTAEYEVIKRQKERERISHLKCTKRVFILILEQLGIDYFETVKPLIEANRQAKLEWELCVELERANPLLNTRGVELGITPEQIDHIFRFANGEVETLAIMEN